MRHRCSAMVMVCLALAAPAAARTLRGGSTATISLPADRLPRHAEEWEAFLSLDGGAHYAIRITPHLDVDVRHATWVVPDVDARDARIMIRAGDERRETSIELPESFSIRRGARPSLPPMRVAPPAPAEQGVVAWAEGDRAGTRIVLAASVSPRAGVASARRGAPVNDALFDAPKHLAPIAVCCSHGVARAASSPRPRAATAARDVLLLSTRLNI